MNKEKKKKISKNLSEAQITLKTQKSSPEINAESKMEKGSEIEEMKNMYEDKIKTLEHQNENLKEELYYLRTAILTQANLSEGTPTSSKVSIR